MSSHDVQPRTAGLSGDHGWGDVDDARLGGAATVLLVIAHGMYWGALWLLSGLAPLPLLATSLRWPKQGSSKQA